jgi:hypothetical protein
MSAGTNAYGARAGFNQSGGAYFMCVQALDGDAGAAGSYINQLTAAPSGSGGAVVAPTLARVAMSTILGAGTTAANASTMVGTGKLLKDMGKTVISAGRTFRKFAPVVSAAGTVSSFGVVGAAAAGANAGYGSFYLEVGREGQGPAAAAPIARYF